MAIDAQRGAFLERLRLQFQARYAGVEVDADPGRFALRLHGPGLDSTLPLSPLYHECERTPSLTPRLIAAFVQAAEGQLARRSPSALSLTRVMWCVRTAEYLDGHAAAGELLTAPVAGRLVAFAAEALPGAVMRGVPRTEWTAAGLDDARVRAAADRNTEARFAGLVGRIAAADRVPRDGWRLTGDLVFQSSLLLVPGALAALRGLAGGDVLVAVPDRAVVLAVAAGDAEAAGRFRRRVLRDFRESMSPLSRVVLRAGAGGLAEEPATPRERIGLLDRLRG